MEKTIPRIGCFLCDPGGRLAQVLDFDSISKKVAKTKGVNRVEVLKEPWGPTSMESIREEIREGKLDRFLWVGEFTPVLMKKTADEFSYIGVNPYLHRWCSLEEQGVMVEGISPEIRNRKALTLIEMGIAALRLCEPMEPVEIPASDTVLIVGAGVAGLHTAASLADLGKRVFLVERESGVGGKVALLSRFYPRMCDPHCGLGFVLDKLEKSDRVSIRNLSRISGISGGPGNFMVRILTGPRFVDDQRCNGCGACAAACPKEIQFSPVAGCIGSGQSPGSDRFLYKTMKAVHPAVPMDWPPAYVIDREQCPEGCRECEKACPSKAVLLDQGPSEEEIGAGAILLTTGWSPYPIEKVEEYGYGRIPGVISNLEMERLLESNETGDGGSPVNRVKEIGFIQCVGSRDERHLRYCSSVCCSATLKQVIRLKELAPAASCHVFCMEVRSSGFEEELYRRARELGNVTFFRDRPATVEKSEEPGKLQVTVLDPAMDGRISLNLDLLVLAGGMCPSTEAEDLARMFNLPRNPYGFFEAHHQCFPEESQRTGIYVGGCAREPMNVAQSIDSSHRAGMKALCFLQGGVKIPPTYPVLEKTKCDQCKRCTEDCPFSAYLFDEKGYPNPDLARCRQCGNCMGTCPLAAISLRNHSIKQSAAQIQVLEKSFMPKKDPMILAFLCENDAYKAAQSAARMSLPVPPNVVFMKTPCAGAVNNALVADALSIGVDGVLIAGCKDDQCHYVRGSQLVRKRSGDLSDKLRKMRIEPERVRFESLEIRDSRRYLEILNDYIDFLKRIGPNPFRL
ncbi:MAG: hydrogenase iron-sulfur subunit [Desulfobacteraceae bacterium]|nr:MAG: hydrogenase iron-sulfur subunit [Desulfobacteraceae bacterium]